MRLPFDPSREVKLQVTLRDPEGNPVPKEYRLRFGMREFLVAESRVNIKVHTNGTGVKEIVERLTDGTLDALMAAFGLMVGRHHDDVTNGEIWDVFDADLEGVERAVYSLLGKSLPAVDPKETPPSESPTETPTAVAPGT